MTLQHENHLTCKKEKGRFGENQVDLWMQSLGWQPVLKNKIFRGGELDRMYVRHTLKKRKQQRSGICLAEIKYVHLKTNAEGTHLFSEAGILRILKKRQLKNLYMLAKTLESRNQGRTVSPRIYIRVFVFLIISNATPETDQVIQLGATGFAKVTRISHKAWIVSIEPEFVQRGQESSILQVGV